MVEHVISDELCLALVDISDRLIEFRNDPLKHVVDIVSAENFSLDKQIG